MTINALQTAIQAAVSNALARNDYAWLVAVRQRVATDRSLLGRLFPVVAKKCGHGPLWSAEPELTGWTVSDAVRALLLVDASIQDITAVYEYGDALERCAVLRALPVLGVGESGIPLVLDALSGNDTRLIAAAVGPYAATYLPINQWRHAVLKCVRLGVSLDYVADLKNRMDVELVGMLRAFAQDRVDHDRPVPLDVELIVRNHTTVLARQSTPHAAQHCRPRHALAAAADPAP